jgi:hypothetical protein
MAEEMDERGERKIGEPTGRLEASDIDLMEEVR